MAQRSTHSYGPIGTALLAAFGLGLLGSYGCSATDETACKSDSAYPAESDGVVPSSLVLQGPSGNFDASEAHSTCASSHELLVLRITAPWCGTCAWHASNYVAEIPEATRKSVRLVDVVVGDADNGTPTLTTATQWASGTTGVDLTVIDPDWTLAKSFASNVQLPAYLLVDPATMKVERTLGNPAPGVLRQAYEDVLSSQRGTAPQKVAADDVYDGTFTKNEWDMIRGAVLPRQLVTDPSNRYADDPIAAAAGRSFFFETDWSKNGSVSCQSCHQPSPAFADTLAVSRGIGLTDRNAPTVLTAPFTRWFFADGRADSAWMQALGPLENANEFGSNRLRVARVVSTKYADSYQRAFGAAPPAMDDTARFPEDALPGDTAWAAMTDADRDAVNRVFANVGKGIAAYERSILMRDTGFDRYASGDVSALSADQKQGLKEFFTFGCAQCHYGPSLSNDAFHTLRFPTGRADGAADLGRAEAFAQLRASEFSKAGPYSDAPVAASYDAPVANERYVGALKTPTLRAVALTAPYGHGGTIPTLEDLIDLYRTHGLPEGDPRTAGTIEPWLVPFGSEDGTHITAFLKSFVGGAQWW